MLESAVHSPINLEHYSRQRNPFQLAADLSEKVMRNHAYMDGNKRTALVAADMFMKIKGYRLLLLARRRGPFCAGGSGHGGVESWAVGEVFWESMVFGWLNWVPSNYHLLYHLLYGVVGYSVNRVRNSRDSPWSTAVAWRAGMGTWRGQYWLGFWLECTIQSTRSMQDVKIWKVITRMIVK